MNHEPTTSHQHTGADAGQPAVPMWLIVLMSVLFYLGALYFDSNGAWFDPNVYGPYHNTAELEKYQPPGNGDWWLSAGRRNFEANCALCHNTDGMGKPNQAPPFVKSEWVLGSPERMIRIPQVGLSGPIEVAGQTYNIASGMGPMGAGLSDEDLAAVLSYIRNSWGNKAEPVTPEQVHAVRGKLAGHPQPFTPEELKPIQ